MKVNIDFLMDKVIEYYTNYEEYARVARLPYSHWVHKGSENGFEKRKEDIRTRDAWQKIALCEVVACMDVLSMTSEERDRVWSAGRAAYRWYKRTNWENCLPDDVAERIGKYIFEEVA